MLTEHEREEQRQRRIKQQMREIEQRRLIGPDRDRGLEGVWVAHVWVPENGVPDKGEWLFAGFRRRRHKRKPQTMGRFFSKVRRQLLIDKRAPVMVTDLDMATRRMTSPDQEWRFRPPQFQRRKPKMKQSMPAIDRTKRKTRAKVRALLLNKKQTRFIALGRMGFDKILPDGTTHIAWDRRPGHLYLGPLVAQKKRDAEREARKLFGIYKELLIIPIEQLSVPLRNAMASSKRVQAGITRIQWPEVPPSFDVMFAKFKARLTKHVFHNAIAPDDERWMVLDAALYMTWWLADCPWLSIKWFQQHIKPWSDACAPAKAKPRKRKRKSTVSSRNASRKTTTASAPKRSLRSMASRVKSVIRSALAMKTKAGRIPTGSRKVPTSTRSVRAVRSRVVTTTLKRKR